MGANSFLRVPIGPIGDAFVRIPAGDDSVPYIKRFIADTGGRFNSKEELNRFRNLKSSVARRTFTLSWKPQLQTEVPSAGQSAEREVVTAHA